MALLNEGYLGVPGHLLLITGGKSLDLEMRQQALPPGSLFLV